MTSKKHDKFSSGDSIDLLETGRILSCNLKKIKGHKKAYFFILKKFIVFNKVYVFKIYSKNIMDNIMWVNADEITHSKNILVEKCLTS